MVELGKAGGHLSASRSRRRDDDERLRCFDIIISAVSLVAHNQRYVAGISVDDVVAVDAYADFFQLALEEIGCLLSGVLGDDDTADIEPPVREGLNQAEHIHIVGDAEIVTYLVLLDVGGIDGDDDLGLVGELHQHA